ncbi:DUF418 domain-containing protein [Brachybacterium fresconis]|uniref:Membrane protein YeiB n=1 Tax=Brachybacterium fresconis TaxID=173363 RepID=A0ABS4YP74_9MICO|nr:DUF418 domain-containing protein [Brachybacterium fresconis]MBP2410549.1 putative membrane protein YeiB [Brachybacterium fresconis]
MAPAGGAGSVPLSRRAGGPDLARGLALLGIALANTVGWLHGSTWTVLLKQQDATAWDRAADVLIALTVDNRGFPLFAMLFGYGIGILHRRSQERGERTGHFLLRMLRRHVALLAIGLAHAILLFQGDILVAYALIGMLCALLMTRRRVVLPLAGIIALPALGVWGWVDGIIGLSDGDGYASAAAPDYLTGLILRAELAGSEVATALVSEIGLLAPMAIGVIAARVRLFEEVEANRDVLAPLARWGIGIGLAGAVPLTAVLVLDPGHQLLDSETALGILGLIHQYSGLLGALGLAAAAALLAEHVRARRAATGQILAESAATGQVRAGGAATGQAPAGGAATGQTPAGGAATGQVRLLGGVVRGIEALGAVSLSAYVGQSLVFAALFPPYTLDLGTRLGTAGAAVIVVVTYLAMIGPAVALRRGEHRGPLEVVLRSLAGSSMPRETGPAPASSAAPSPARRPGGRS